MAEQRLTILLVQATVEERHILTALLADPESRHLTLESAPGGAPGLAIMQRNSHDVILFSDGETPGAGVQLLREAIRHGVRAPMILVTDTLDAALDLEVTLAGAADCLLLHRLDESSLRRALLLAVERAAVLHALRESEERFRALVENSTDAILLTTADHTIIYASRSLGVMLDRPSSDIVGADALSLVHPDERERARARLGDAIAHPGRVVHWEFRLQRRDGVWRHAEGTAACRLHEPAVRAIVLNFRDVTYRRWIEKELLESEERFRRLVDDAPVQIWIDDAERRLVFMNRTALEFTGRSLEQELGEGWVEAMHPDDLPGYRIAYEAAVTARQPFRHEYRVRRHNGVYRWFLGVGVPRLRPDGTFQGYIGSDTDITDLLATSERLTASEERYRAFITQSSEGIYRIEIKPLDVGTPEEEQLQWFYKYSTLAECNDAMARMYGYEKSGEMIGAKLADMLPLDEPQNMEMLRNYIHSGYRLVDAETRELDREGRVKFFLNNLVGIVENGRLVRTWGAQRDITDRKGLEEQFRQSRKMETAGRLAGGIAHDFNNLLTAILGTSEMLLSDLATSDPHREDVEEIKRAANRAANLTRQLLAFSRRQVLLPKVIDLNAVVRGTERMLRRLIGEDIILIARLAPALGRVKADPGQVEQVILNLSLNARDAMPQGGTLLIETADVDLDRDHGNRLPAVVPGPYVLLAVSDDGVGMSAETQNHLFEPFFTTKEQGKGTGLGLAMVYGIVKQSGGYIYAASELGHGSSFKIYLPRVEDAAEPLESPPLPAAPAGAHETVLLVEDEDAVRRLARRVLESRGYRVLEAAHGGDALQIAIGHPEIIDLLVTDIVMPGMSGQELAGRLLNLRPGIKVLYVSGYNDDAIRHHGALGPGTAFLQKPFTPDILSSKVNEVLRGG